MLKTRIITGIFLIGFIFWTIFSLPPELFIVVVGLLSFFMMREWMNLMGLKHRIARVLILDFFIVGEFVLYWCLPHMKPFFWAACVFWLLTLPLLAVSQIRQRLPQFPPALCLSIGYFTILAMFAGLLSLRLTLQGQSLVLMAFALVWCSDSIAYAVGRLMGKHKLISTVSPGKTWEGFIGAACLTVPLMAVYAHYVMDAAWPGLFWAILIVYLIIMALVGDLFESLIKRIYHVKDSGTILPGHGGLLDRFDSLMAVAPVFACLNLQGWFS